MRPSGFYYPDALIRLFAAVERYVWCRVKTGNDKRGFETTLNDRAPRGRELSVREDLTRIIVDWSGSWQAARPGN